MNKIELRNKYINVRSLINNKDKKSTFIFNKIIDLDIYKESKVIAIYKSLDSEANTDKLIEYSLTLGKTVLLPRVVDTDMIFLKYNLNNKLEKSRFGILEPINDLNNIYNSKIDIVIVPGICFDLNKNRLGFGKGYYDKFLNINKSYKIGICFEEQVLKDDFIDIDNYDIPMDIVISDKKVYY